MQAGYRVREAKRNLELAGAGDGEAVHVGDGEVTGHQDAAHRNLAGHEGAGHLVLLYHGDLLNIVLVRVKLVVHSHLNTGRLVCKTVQQFFSDTNKYTDIDFRIRHLSSIWRS